MQRLKALRAMTHTKSITQIPPASKCLEMLTFRGINTEEKMLEDPRLHRDRVRVPRRDSYEKRPVLSATIHPDIKRTLVAMSERTGMTVSQVADEVLYTGLIEMQELDAQG